MKGSVLKKSAYRFIVCVAIACALVITLIPFSLFDIKEAQAASTVGYINVSDSVTVKTLTGSGSLKSSKGNVVKVYSNEKVTVLDTNQVNGNYKIQANFDGETVTGLLPAEYVQIYDGTYDANYAASLKAAGFPDSYLPALCYLHKTHPNWVFKPQFTGVGTSIDTSLDWNEVIKNEQAGNRNVIQKVSGFPAAWYSYDSSQYYNLYDVHITRDGKKTEYNSAGVPIYGSDTNGFVKASDEKIAFHLDPRNMLNDKLIYSFMDLSFDKNVQKLEGVQKIVAGTFMKGALTDNPNKTYAQVFMEAANQSNVNPYVLATMVIIEQGSHPDGTGLPGNISGKYPGYAGYYNYYNIGATDGNNATQKGLIFASTTPTGANPYNRPWNSVEKSIKGGALFQSSSYISAGQNTLYLEKFDVMGSGSGLYNHQYCTGLGWVESQSMNMRKAYMSITDTVVFTIPVYKNMPAEPCPMPDVVGSPNNYLRGLSVTSAGRGFTLTPGFNAGTTEYSLIVPANAETITVSATNASPTAKVSGAGDIKLNMGSNTVAITVTAQSGAKRVYKINVFRKESTGETISSTAYKIDKGYVMAAAPGTNVNSILGAITVSGSATKSIVSSDGKTALGGDAVVATGCKLMTDENSYTIIVNGDPSGDGIVSLKDLLIVRRQLLGLSNMNATESLAANVTGSGTVGLKDLLMMRKHILGTAKIGGR